MTRSSNAQDRSRHLTDRPRRPVPCYRRYLFLATTLFLSTLCRIPQEQATPFVRRDRAHLIPCHLVPYPATLRQHPDAIANKIATGTETNEVDEDWDNDDNNDDDSFTDPNLPIDENDHADLKATMNYVHIAFIIVPT